MIAFEQLLKNKKKARKKKNTKETNISSAPFSSSNVTTRSSFMCLSTDQLKFLDMTHYIAPVFSSYKAYGCEVTKGHFPYEYMNCLEELDDSTLIPKEAFFSLLKTKVFPMRITPVAKRRGARTARQICVTFSSGTTI